MTRADMTVQEQSAKAAIIRRIRTLTELDGYADQAARDGMWPGEQALIATRRIELLKGR